ncbi:MAG: hypothetical protein RMK29_05250 [Myxococcales bacterium]|nr:hypothetical protein [Myxococcota bacterium]MDW8281097.1 hypothetical protein [Myxococcales bacterium]
MSMAPDEICRRLGEAWFREHFQQLTTAQMKEGLSDAKIPTVRAPGQMSTRKRNEEWARRMWRSLPTPTNKIGGYVLYQWLSRHRNEMMGAFLDALGVAHNAGLTEEDFWPRVDDEKLLAAARALLDSGRFDRKEVAAYLLFLEAQHQTDRLAPLRLAELLPPA